MTQTPLWLARVDAPLTAIADPGGHGANRARGHDRQGAATMSMTQEHRFPDGTVLAVNAQTAVGHRVGHLLDADCHCLPWLYALEDGKRLVVVHVPDEVST